MRKLLLILFLLVAATAQATTIQMQNPNLATMVIPDGSAITSEIFELPGGTATGRWIMDFSFADGIGHEWNDYNDGGQGWITFNAPVSNLIVNWTASSHFSMEGFAGCYSATCPHEGVMRFDGAISGIKWWVYGGGSGGVTSMSYEVPQLAFAQQAAVQQVSEPPSLTLLPLGLAGLWMARRKRTRTTPSAALGR